MIAYNGITKRRCSIKDRQIVIGGEQFDIVDIREIENYSIIMGIGWALFVAGFVGMALFMYHLIGDYLLFGYDKSDGSIKMALGIIGFIIYLLGFTSFFGMLGYRGYWKINSIMVFIEKGDSDEIYLLLKKIQQDLSHSSVTS